jgi:signal transduction histidine kinase/DNA-binding response OmpR family regulator
MGAAHREAESRTQTLERVMEEVEPKEEALEKSGSDRVAALEVLVVDDERIVRDFVAKVLRRAGFSCRTAGGAKEAVSAVMDDPPALVITDLRMPGNDGLWLQVELGERWPEIPVILLTAVSDAKQAVRCLKAGAHDYLVKPIDIDELLISVHRAAERVHLLDQARRHQQEMEETVRNRTALLRAALGTIEGAYQDTLVALVNAQTPESRSELPVERREDERAPLPAEDATELASLRMACKLIAEGCSYVDVAAAMGKELVDQGVVQSAKLWSKRCGESSLDETLVAGEDGGPGAAALARRALATGETQSQERDGLTAVVSPVVVRGVPECAFHLRWRGGPRKDMQVLVERLTLMLASSLSRERDARARHRTEEELDIFQKLASASRYSLDLQCVAEFLMKSLHRLLDYDVAALLLLEDAPSLTVQARCRMDEDFSNRVRSHISNTLKLTCGLLVPEDLDVRMLETGLEPGQEHALHKLRSLVNVPLTVGGSVVGLIHVSSGRDHAFGEEEILFVHRAAEFLASSVQGVRELLATVKGRVEQMVDHMADGVLMLDGRGKVVAMNGAARYLLEFHGESETMDAAALSRVLEWDPMSTMREERRILRRVVCLRGVPYQTQLSPVEDAKGDLVGTVLAFRDFEQEKRVDEMKTELVNVVSHELRTPLTAVRNALSLLAGSRLGPLNEGQARFIDLAKRNVDQLVGIINDLLDLSKIEAGKMHFDLAPLSLEDPVREALQAMEPQAEAKGVVVDSVLSSGLPVVFGHAPSIQRILVNLLGNAIKFTGGGGRVSVEMALEEGVNPAESRRAVRVSVTDSGVGIPADEHESIFEKFRQVEAQRQTTSPGTGLGLPICRELVRMHYGQIWVESEENRGSRFSFSIPVLSQSELLMHALSAEVARAKESDSPMVLVLARVGNRDSFPGKADGERADAMHELLEITRAVVRHSSDRILSAADAAEIAIVLPRTPRDGGTAFERRLTEAIELGRGKSLPLRLSSVQYPEDGRTAKELYHLASEKIGDSSPSEIPRRRGDTVVGAPGTAAVS